MNIRSGFFNSINGDRRYEADFFADYFATFIGDGIFANPSDNFQVMANDDMTIRVRPGSAWIKGYVAFNDSDYKFALEAASGVLNRIDRVVLRLDVADRQIKLEVKRGEPAEVPDPMELERSDNAWELALADVYVGKGVISLTQADITDRRFDDDLCGIVKGVVDEIDTTDLFAQYDAEFHDWLDGLRDALDGDVAGNLMNLINEVKDEVDARFHNIKELSGAVPVIDLTENINFKQEITEKVEYTIIPEVDKEMQEFNLIITLDEVAAIYFPENVVFDTPPFFNRLNTPYIFSFTSVNYGDKWIGEINLVDYPSVQDDHYLATDSDFGNSLNYINGNELLVELPDIVHGKLLRDASIMFNHSYVKSVRLLHQYVKNMGSMFQGSKATELDLTYFDTTNVTNMNSMFLDSQPTVLDLSSFDTSNVTNMSAMFRGSQATKLDLSSFDTSNVTDMTFMFLDLKATELDLTYFDTTNVTNMSAMFQGSQATELDLTSFDTSNVTSMPNMFRYIQATELDLSSFDTSNVTNMNSMFGSSQVKTIYARTQADANRFKQSSGFPSGVNVIVK